MDFRRTSTALDQAAKLQVVSVDDVKAQERITNSYEDNRIKLYVEAAYNYLAGPDGWLGRCCLLEETFEVYSPDPARGFELPMRPFLDVTSVTAFEVTDANGVYGAVSPALYNVVAGQPNDFGFIARGTGATWPRTGSPYEPRRYRAAFKAGFGDAAAVPAEIRLSIIMLAAHFYQNREATFADNKITVTSREIEFGLRNLCGRYRVSPDHS